MSRIFHLSDLHIAGELIPHTRTFLTGLEGHNIEVWHAFKNHLLSRIREINDDNYIILVTGDLTATGNVNSLDLCEQLLFDNPQSPLYKDIGLKLPREKFIIIPGNHDSYGGEVRPKNTLIKFNGRFYPNAEYPITKDFRLGALDVAIIGFDSTYTDNAYTLPKKLGRGIIRRNQYHIADGFLRGKNNDFIIACLHHNPIFPPNIKRDWNLILENANDFVSWLTKANVDMVLFGHIHDDFYDVLPLKGLLKYMPKKRGLGRFAKRLFWKTNILMEYEPIRINGKAMRYIDVLAYWYIRTRNSNKQYCKPTDFTSKIRFEKYLHELPEYEEFLGDLGSFHNTSTALIMAGSACQHNNERKNSYIEMHIGKEDGKFINVFRHRYNAINGGFDTKTTRLTFN